MEPATGIQRVQGCEKKPATPSLPGLCSGCSKDRWPPYSLMTPFSISFLSFGAITTEQ